MITTVDTPPFDRWASKALAEDERQELSVYLGTYPTAGVLIQGTGGLRKVRWAPAGQGKSGAYRVIYYFHDERAPIFLITGYAKNEKANLSAKDRAAFKQAIALLKAAIRLER